MRAEGLPFSVAVASVMAVGSEISSVFLASLNHSEKRLIGSEAENIDCLSFFWIVGSSPSMKAVMYSFVRPFLFMMPPELAHRATIEMLHKGQIPCSRQIVDPRLEVKLWGKTFSNPIGMAAGFDKNAKAYTALLKLNFGFVEVGTITPKAQPGNPRPRMFRLVEDKAVINRLGFNNEGKDAAHDRLKNRDRSKGIVGINIGKNRDTVEAVEDYLIGLRTFYPIADYITVNISSPNTEGLRALQQRDALRSLVTMLKTEQKQLQAQHHLNVPILVKLAPDLTDAELEQIVDVAMECNVEGLILTNTTIIRPSTLRDKHKSETGGLSGQPLKTKALEVTRKIYRLTNGRLPLIGVGGISSAQDAIERMEAGASLIQLYTGLIYEGPELIPDILNGMLSYLEQQGLQSVTELTGRANT